MRKVGGSELIHNFIKQQLENLNDRGNVTSDVRAYCYGDNSIFKINVANIITY